jgi:cell surface protein SprA
MSFGALPTLFQGSGAQEVEGIKAIFSQFEKNRAIVSHRLAQEVRTDTAYSEGYGRTQQQVLVPAFLAAYTGKDAKTFTLDIFKLLPKANWRLSYNGLAKLPLFADLFQSFTLTHGYKSTLTVNSFITGLDFLRTRPVGGINPLNGNFYPRLEIPDITINESFNPLVSIAATLKSGMNFNFEYKSSRILQMSFVSNQLAETRTKEILIGYGHNIPDFNFPFAKAKKSKAKKAPKKPLPSILGGNNGQNGQNTSQSQPHNLRLQFNFSLRDDVTFNHLLDQNVIEPTRGNFALSISPSAEYKVNQRLSLRLFTDYRRNRPRTSAGFPRTEVNGGLVVRFQLN